jgi:hypothetical protein
LGSRPVLLESDTLPFDEQVGIARAVALRRNHC